MLYEEQTIPFDLQTLLDNEVNQGEILQWSCQPSTSHAVKKAMIAMAFGIILIAFCSFCGIYLFRAYQNGIEIHLGLIQLLGLSVLAGLFLISAPYRAAHRAKKTVYGITNKRAMIIINKRSELEISSFGTDQFSTIIKRVKGDGSGDLIFDRIVTYKDPLKKSGEKVIEVGFIGIPEVNVIENMIKAIA